MIWIKDQKAFQDARSRLQGCYLCDASLRRDFEKDHIVPKSMLLQFGPEWVATLRVCPDCHKRKNQVEQNAIRLHKTITEEKPMPERERFPVDFVPQELLIPGASPQALVGAGYFLYAAIYWARGWMALLYGHPFPGEQDTAWSVLSPFIESREKGGIGAAEKFRTGVRNILYAAIQRKTVDVVELPGDVASFQCTWISDGAHSFYCVWSLFVPKVDKYRSWSSFEPSPFVGCVKLDRIPDDASITRGPWPETFR